MLDFATCERLVSSARDKRSKPYDNNTRVERRDEDTYALRLHSTDIATFHRDGRITLNSGGWRTVTTKDRLQAVTPHLLSERGVWYVRAEPDAEDPEPEYRERTIPKPFHALDPGPEPVKSEAGTELFERQHYAWNTAMNGSGWGRRRTYGYKKMVECLEEYGSREAWREAYLTEFREVRAQRKEHKAWIERNRVLFEDGMEITPEGYAPRPNRKAMRRQKNQERKVARMKEKINKFVNGAVQELVVTGLPMPSGGDCWYCAFAHAPQESEQQPGAISMGDAMPTLHADGSVRSQPHHDHLLDHMRERYYVPSMFVNALREANYRDAGIYMFLAMDPENDRMGGPQEGYHQVDVDAVTRALRRYLYKRLIPEFGSSTIMPLVGNTGTH